MLRDLRSGVLGIRVSRPEWVAEVLLASFLLTAAYKGLTIGWPVDITLLTGLFTAGAALYRTREAGWTAPRPIVWLLAIFALLAIPMVAAPMNSYGAEKAMKFYSIVGIAALAPALIVRSATDLSRFMNALLVVSFALAVGILATGNVVQGRLAYEGVSSIGVGRATGLAAFLLALRAIYRGRVLYAVAAGLCAAATIGIGNRQGLLAAACALAVSLLASPRRTFAARLTVAAAAVVLIFAATPLWETLPQHAVARMAMIMEGEIGASGEVRIQMLEAAFTESTNALVGSGWGSFADLRFGALASPQEYPHNLFAEVFYEMGVIAFLVVVAGTVVGIIRALRAVQMHRGEEFVALLGVLVFTTIAASLSGDLYVNKEFWAVLSIAVCAKSIVKK